MVARTSHKTLFDQLKEDPEAAMILSKEDWAKLKKLRVSKMAKVRKVKNPDDGRR